MGDKKKDNVQEMNLENLNHAIDRYQRENVMSLLRGGALTGLTGEERTRTCRRLASLRSMEIMDFLSRQKEPFTADMLRLDFSVFQNKKFVQEVLEKYSKKFDLSDAEECRKLFSLACSVDDGKTVRNLIRQKKATDCYERIGAASMPVFEQIAVIPVGMIHDDQRVDLFFQACLSKEYEEKIAFMRESGIDFFMKNTAGKNVIDLFEERLKTFHYSNDKKGRMQKLREEQTLIMLKKIQQENGQSGGKIKGKRLIALIVVICVIVAAIIGGAAAYRNGSGDAETTDSSAEEETASYSTDTSLVVEDGDTVNIDYTGYIDDAEFDGGSTDGAGTDLTIGSGSYIDDFEEQLIGANVGDTVEVSVTFPDDYGVDELNGQDALFEVTINGIYE
ncbi:MAG: FKBP-type peptidyl-prolyl cis-trans isomerase [Clostridiales bacterium]|nr:FKBP-type peptidyl-prolyl cis-trans isomerase [Clostridiales bacterium]